jgi:hypothetical protein
LFETKLAFNVKRQPTDYMLKHVKKHIISEKSIQNHKDLKIKTNQVTER